MTKRYYWIKLRTDFFDLETIDWLISQPNGCEYVVLYQKLCLLTANKGGELSSAVGEIIVPYDVNKIARDTKFSFDTVVVALELFKKIGLIYEQENGILKIPYVDDVVGSETEYAQKKRNYRLGLKTNVETLSETSSETLSSTLSDKSIDKDIDIEKDTDKDSEKKKKKSKIESDFEECWSIYPKKQGKAEALKAYKKFAQKDPELKEKVIAGITEYIEYIRISNIEIKFVKKGSTYFNGECWYDEYDVKGTEKNGESGGESHNGIKLGGGITV